MWLIEGYFSEEFVYELSSADNTALLNKCVVIATHLHGHGG